MLRPGKDKGLATPIPLGLATLAATTFCVGVGAIFQSSAAWAPYAMQALILGGLVELLGGNVGIRVWRCARRDHLLVCWRVLRMVGIDADGVPWDPRDRCRRDK